MTTIRPTPTIHVHTLNAVGPEQACSDPAHDRMEEAHYRLLRLLDASPRLTQRELAREMGVSLGKVNYCVNALIEKGWVKARNFRNSNNKLAHVDGLPAHPARHRAEGRDHRSLPAPQGGRVRVPEKGNRPAAQGSGAGRGINQKIMRLQRTRG